ncbi:hypothetical protein AAC387_Pa02g2117 [Persea americana]
MFGQDICYTIRLTSLQLEEGGFQYNSFFSLWSQMGKFSKTLPNEVLFLFRSLLHTVGTFSDYNIREYAKRRKIDGFRQNRILLDPSSIALAFYDGKSQLEVAKNQAIVYSLYAPKSKSMMEIKSK